MTPLEPHADLRVPGLTLGELERLLSRLTPRLEGSAAVRVAGVRHDSRDVLPGEMFVARRGRTSDGARHAAEAVGRGAVAVLCELDAELAPLGVPVLRVSDARRGLALSAEGVYGSPSRSLSVLGVTGTNGKTTTATLLADALARLGARPAILGTLGFGFEGRLDEGSHTTPEADDISRRMFEVKARGGTHFVMEVSSHALAQERVAGLRFDTCAFTNLTQDHLDFHGSMAAYGAEKARLFTELLPNHSVICTDAAFGKDLASRIEQGLLTVARKGPADVRVSSATIDARGIRASLSVRGEPCELQSRLVGEHNLENLLVALGVLLCLGFSAENAARALGSAQAAPGRLERCDAAGDDVMVLVDYAHTPDALARVLATLRALTEGSLWCVFGCGGDRDPDKRPKMGQAVADTADVAIVTNDNPRSEAPEAIARAIVPPLAAKGTRYDVVLDRRAAIERSVLEAAPGDCVLIAGKGHETYQIFGSERVSFDDRVEARRALGLRRARGSA